MNTRLSELNVDEIGLWPTYIKILIIGLFSIMILFLGYHVDISDQSERLHQAKQHEQQLQQQLLLKQQQLAERKTLQRRLLQLKPITQSLSSRDDIPDKIGLISQLAAHDGLSIQEMKPLPESHVKKGYNELVVQLKAVGHYAQLATFIHHLISQKQLLGVGDISIAATHSADDALQLESDLLITIPFYEGIKRANLATIAPQKISVASAILCNPFTAQHCQKKHLTPATVLKPRSPVDSDKHISLDFQNISVRDVLQLMAKFAGTNVIMSDAVRGNITLQLRDIPWQQALSVILKMRGLGQRQIGNVLLIAPLEEVTLRAQQELKARQQALELEPLHAELFSIHYSKAAAVSAMLKGKGQGLLSARGVVRVDPRTNAVWVQDVPSKMTAIRRLIAQLDVPMQQVLIEARVVNIDHHLDRDIGARLGLSSLKQVSGKLEGANSVATGNDLAHIPLKDRLNFDMGAIPSEGKAASFGFALMKLGHGIMLDLELSALESAGEGEVISSPRLITANQQPAEIQAGEEIPYQESTSSGATNVSFKKAVLSLQVTPQITPDKKILLKLKINQDKPSVRLINNVPSIDTREVTTQVLVDNGQTIVLGGIYEQVKENQEQKVPVLGDIPGVGMLFRKKHTVNHRRELLIFVTPKLI